MLRSPALLVSTTWSCCRWCPKKALNPAARAAVGEIGACCCAASAPRPLELALPKLRGLVSVRAPSVPSVPSVPRTGLLSAPSVPRSPAARGGALSPLPPPSPLLGLPGAAGSPPLLLLCSCGPASDLALHGRYRQQNWSFHNQAKRHGCTSLRVWKVPLQRHSIQCLSHTTSSQYNQSPAQQVLRSRFLDVPCLHVLQTSGSSVAQSADQYVCAEASHTPCMRHHLPEQRLPAKLLSIAGRAARQAATYLSKRPPPRVQAARQRPSHAR